MKEIKKIYVSTPAYGGVETHGLEQGALVFCDPRPGAIQYHPLIEENEEKLTLIACWDDTDENGGRGIVIPKPWIVKREKLEVCQENN